MDSDERPYGVHLTVDGYDGDRALLGSEQVVRSAVRELVDRLELIPISELVSTELTAEVYASHLDSRPDEASEQVGISAGIQILQSHIHLHTYSARGVLFADLFVCGDLDADLALSLLRCRFRLESFDHMLVRRGLRFHRPTAVARE